MQKKFISIILSFVSVVCIVFSFSGCNKKEDKIKTYGDFLYSVVYYDVNGQWVIKEKGVRSSIMIMGLSEMGQEKEIVVLPEYINGLKVEQLGYEKMWSSEGCWESENLKKLIISTPVSMISGIFGGCINLEKIILLMHDKYDDYRNDYMPVYLTSYHYIEGEYTTNFFKFHGGNYYFSNVSYRYNYNNAPNDGYYWIDDYDYGSSIEYIPEPPVREGYTFDGWYKQPECIDEWNFNRDTLPQARYTEDNDEIYQETNLYAKWIKN